MKKFTKRGNENRTTTQEIKRHTFSGVNEVGKIVMNNAFTKPEKEDSPNYHRSPTADIEVDVRQKVLCARHTVTYFGTFQ